MATTAQISAIQQLYVAYFNRPADAAGLDFWAKQVTNGASLATISATFAATPEYKALFAGKSNDQVVATIYQNLFNRAPDAAGLKFWSDKLTDKALTVDNVVEAVAASAQQDPAKGPDTVAIQSKVAAAVAFTDYLNTNVDARIAYSSGTVNAVGVNYIHGVTDATTLAAAKTALPTTTSTALITGNQLPGTTVALTITPDTIVGGSGNDTFNANTDSNNKETLTDLDSIDGGAGVDTLNVVSASGSTLDLTSAGPSITVKNVENVNLVSTKDIAADTSGWTGVTQLTTSSATKAVLTAAATTNVTATVAGATGAITVDGGLKVAVTATGAVGGSVVVGGTTAPKGAVSVTTSASGTAVTSSTIEVDGGTTVNVTSNLVSTTKNADITGGAIAVNGTADTTSVTVTQSAAVAKSGTKAGVVVGAVDIADVNAGDSTKTGTITTVSLSNYGNSTIASSALSTLTLAGKSGTLDISGDNVKQATTLNLTVNGLSGTNTISDTKNHFKAINITTTGADSSIAGFADTAATSLTVSGDKALTLVATGLTGLTSATVSGAAGLSTDVSALTKLATVNASASTGENTVTVDSTVTAYTGGSGVDTVTITKETTKAIDGGAGSADELVLNNTAATFTTVIADNAKISGFEILGLGAAADGNYDATGFSALHVAGAVAADVGFINVAAGATLAIDAAPGNVVTYTLKTNTAADAVNLSLGTADADGIDFSGKAVVLTSIENVTINSLGSNEDGSFVNKALITDATATSLTVTGTESLTLTGFAGSTLKTIDATGIGADLSLDVTALTLASAGVTFKGGDGNYSLTDTNLAAGKVLSFTAGNGDNAVTLSSATTGKATVTLGDGDNTVTLTGSTGASTITAGSGENTIVLGTGASIVTLAVDTDDADSVTVGVPATANNYASITGLTTDDVLKFAAVGTEIWAGAAGTGASAKISLDASTALFADYVTAASAVGDGTNGAFSWFQFGGNTYIVEDNSAAAGFQAGADLIVKLTGLVDLTDATLGAAQITLA